MDSSENQESRIFIGNIAPDTDRDLIEQHFKVEILKIRKSFFELFAKKNREIVEFVYFKF